MIFCGKVVQTFPCHFQSLTAHICQGGGTCAAHTAHTLKGLNVINLACRLYRNMQKLLTSQTESFDMDNKAQKSKYDPKISYCMILLSVKAAGLYSRKQVQTLSLKSNSK